MPSFDIVENSGKAYIKTWQERQYLFRLALVPIFVKIVFFFIVLTLEYQNNIIRQTLVMLPAYFLEGWLLAHVVRMVWLDQRWPMRLSGNPEADAIMITERYRCIFGGMVMYVLLKMVQSALFAPLLNEQSGFHDLIGPTPPDPSGFLFFFSIFALAVLVWAFRFLFVYIPIAANLPLIAYIRKFSDFMSSFYFIGAWLVCYVPFLLATALLVSVIRTAFADLPEIGVFIILNGHLLLDTIANIVITICLTYGIKSIIEEKNAPPENKL